MHLRAKHLGMAFMAVLFVVNALTPLIADAQAPVTLRVALYPFVPNYRALYQKLEAAFEAANPGVNLELVDTIPPAKPGDPPTPIGDGYYGGDLPRVEADVYEIDSVLLSDMVKKLAPIVLPSRSFLPGTVEALQLSSRQWAVPHWVCGNFLFYRKGDSAVAEAKTWQDLIAALGGRGLVADFKGSSTLGEWYLTALAATAGDPATLVATIKSGTIDQTAVAALASLLQTCPAGFCRSRPMHDTTGFYARMFARGRARAYIGYSETLHYALHEIAASCGSADGCRDPNEIAVKSLPSIGSTGSPVGWVDGLAISNTLSGTKRDLALRFIDFATSWNGYQTILNEEASSGFPPPYLLPALAPLSFKELDPPGYPAFWSALLPRIFLVGDGLNESLRAAGKKVECLLAPDRGDAAWMKACQPH